MLADYDNDNLHAMVPVEFLNCSFVLDMFYNYNICF